MVGRDGGGGGRALLLVALTGGLLATGLPACGRTLQVGPGQEYATPSAAAAAAADGDLVLIAPGDYYDCTVWRRDHLTVAGAAPGVVITDSVCQGKAVFVVTGDQVTVQDLTLARARVPDGNGAGIRAENRTLTVERVRFRDNEVGLLSGVDGPGAINVSDCVFEGNQGGPDARRPALQAGNIDLLHVTGSMFRDNRGGQIVSAAGRTVLEGDTFTQDGPGGPTIAVVVNGDVLAEANTFQFATGAGATALRAMGDGAPVLRRNRVVGDGARDATLLVNWTGSDPVLEGNEVGAAELVTTAGVWRHRASSAAHAAWNSIHAAAGLAKRAVAKALGR